MDPPFSANNFWTCCCCRINRREREREAQKSENNISSSGKVALCKFIDRRFQYFARSINSQTETAKTWALQKDIFGYKMGELSGGETNCLKGGTSSFAFLLMWRRTALGFNAKVSSASSLITDSNIFRDQSTCKQKLPKVRNTSVHFWLKDDRIVWSEKLIVIRKKHIQTPFSIFLIMYYCEQWQTEQ